MKDTQLESWNNIKDSIGDRQYEVYKEIRKAKANGRTLFELVDSLQWPVNNISGRVTELSRKGHIEDSGERRVNPASGKKGVVWVVK